MASIWQTILRYFEQHPTGVAVISAIIALLALVAKPAWKLGMAMYQFISGWHQRRHDEQIWQKIPDGSHKLSQLATLFKMKHQKLAASLRRLRDRGKPLIHVEVDGPVSEDFPEDEIWRKTK